MDGGTILVVGGTGMLGEGVVRRLGADGFAVRLLARDVNRARARLGPGIEVAAGDVADAASVERALDGCLGVHVSLSSGPDPAAAERVQHRGTATVAELAARAGVRRLTYLSHGLAAADATIPDHQAKFRAEEAIAGSGVPYTVFKPSYVMETLPRHVRGRRAVVMGRQPHPFHMVAADDLAAMVARSLRTPEPANRRLFVQGPESVTIPDALRLYCSLVAPGTRVVTVPLRAMALVDRLAMRGALRGTVELMGAMGRLGERGDPTEANRLLGAPPTTLRAWCEQRAEARRSR